MPGGGGVEMCDILGRVKKTTFSFKRIPFGFGQPKSMIVYITTLIFTLDNLKAVLERSQRGPHHMII